MFCDKKRELNFCNGYLSQLYFLCTKIQRFHSVPLFFQFTDGDDSENAEERERRCNRQREALIQFKEDSSSDAVVDNVTTTTTGVCGSRLQGI